MKARSKIILDRIIAKPSAFLLNLIVWPLGKIFPRNHSDSPDKVKVIVIAKLLGMGSVLRATPLIRALRQKYPSAKYVFITTHKNKALVERIPLIDKIYFIRDISPLTIVIDTIFLIINLWKNKIDLYFDLEVYSAFSTILATLSLARNRYGFYRESIQFRMGLNTHLIYFNDHRHISEIYFQFARACGIVSRDYKIEKIKLKDEDKSELKEWLKSHSLSEDTPYIVINPNVSDLLLERRWPMDYFVLLINALAMNWSNPIFILGSPEESVYVNALWNRLSGQAKSITFNVAGKFSLGTAVALIYKAKLMITNDSGLYHIAASAGIPLVSLWGPGDPAHYADMANDKNFIFYRRDIYCSPCIYKVYFPPCRGNNICMKSISPKEVYKKACEVLGIALSPDTLLMEEVYRKESQQILDITIRTPRI